LWDAILPDQALRLPPVLAELDRLLDDPRFFEPFRPYFHPSQGRPSVPMETYNWALMKPAEGRDAPRYQHFRAYLGDRHGHELGLT
jgi:hypothetical protein